MARKKVTSSDVAEKAGVSQATVSMVLNHKYNVSFSRETVEKVESVLDVETLVENALNSVETVVIE